MNILEIIEAKKNKKRLSEDQIKFFVLEFTNGNIPDYQASALLMAIYLNGVDTKELYYLTKYNILSGQEYKYPRNFKSIIDKHSTGGVGDKVTLIISPILASLSLQVAKLSGRGLSYTGGTIDKLESIGVNTQFTFQDTINLLEKHSMFLSSQNDSIVPADGKLYALRDVTGTVNNFDLIACSIMSKKLAIHSDFIFLDIKVGDGAFCKNLKEGKILAKKILGISRAFKRKTFIHLTSMDEPLGRMIGNKIEVLEAINFLKDFRNSDSRLRDLIFSFCIDILLKTKISPNKDDAISKIKHVLESKKSLTVLLNYLKDNGSNINFDNNDWYQPKFMHHIKAKKEGYVKIKSNMGLGLVSVKLGAGRETKNSILDMDAGIELKATNNTKVFKNDVIATLYSSSEIDPNIIKIAEGLFDIKSREQKNNPIILKVMN